MQAHADLKNEKASVLSLAYYPLSSPILSMAFIDVEEHDFSDESPTKAPYVVDYFSDPENTRQQEYESAISNEQLNGFLVKLLTIQRKCLQSMDVRYIPGKHESDDSVKEEKEIVGDNAAESDSEAPSTSLRGSGDGLASMEEKKKSASLAEVQAQPTQNTQRPSSMPEEFFSEDATPVLLTPESFLTSLSKADPFKQLEGNDQTDENGSYQSITALSSEGIGLAQRTVDDESKPSAGNEPTAVQPSSGDDTVETLFSKSAVKSPDLISSASIVDDVRQPSTPIAPPPGLPARTIPGVSVPFIEPNLFHLKSISANPEAHSSWPQVLDVAVANLNQSSSVLSSINPPTSTPHRVIDESSSIQHSLPVTSPSVSRPSLSGIISQEKVLQEEKLAEQSRKLDEVAKTQNKLHKQVESSFKRSEQQGTRIEKAIASVDEKQLQLSNDVRASRSATAESVAAKVEKLVKSEIKKAVLPEVTASVEGFKDRLTTAVNQQLAAADTVMKETIKESISSKDIVDRVSGDLAKLLHDRIRITLPDLLVRNVVPAFEGLCQSMFIQLSSTYTRGMNETVKHFDKQVPFRLRNECDRLQHTVREANEGIKMMQNATKAARSEMNATIRQHLSSNMEAVLKKSEERITNRIMQSISKENESNIARQKELITETVTEVLTNTIDKKVSNVAILAQSSLPGLRPPSTSLLRHASIAHQQEQILKLFQQGDVNLAFETALNASDLDVVMYACEMANPGTLFNVVPCPLTQPILLSLIQQLSTDLSQKSELKIQYLQECIMNLDTSHSVTKQLVEVVANNLIQSIDKVYRNSSQPLRKEFRMLSMAAKSLLV